MGKKKKAQKLSPKQELLQQVKAERKEKTLHQELEQNGLTSQMFAREILIIEDIATNRTVSTAKQPTDLTPMVDLIKNSSQKISANKFKSAFKDKMGGLDFGAAVASMKHKHHIPLNNDDKQALANHSTMLRNSSAKLGSYREKLGSVREVLEGQNALLGQDSPELMPEFLSQLSQLDAKLGQTSTMQSKTAQRIFNLSGFDSSSEKVTDKLDGLSYSGVMKQLKFQKTKQRAVNPDNNSLDETFETLANLMADFYTNGSESFLSKSNTSFSQLNEGLPKGFGEVKRQHASELSREELQKEFLKAAFPSSKGEASGSQIKMGDALQSIIEGATTQRDKVMKKLQPSVTNWAKSINADAESWKDRYENEKAPARAIGS